MEENSQADSYVEINVVLISSSTGFHDLLKAVVEEVHVERVPREGPIPLKGIYYSCNLLGSFLIYDFCFLL